MGAVRKSDPAAPGFVGVSAVRMETGEQFVRLCLPVDRHGPRLDRAEIARLRALLDGAEAQFEALPDDCRRHVVPVSI